MLCLTYLQHTQGAGMMAIPKAFKLLGVIPGSVLMLLIACLTFFTLAGGWVRVLGGVVSNECG